MKAFTAGSNEEGLRLSRFVFRVTQNFPNNLLYKSFRNGRIKVNGRKAKPDALLQQGDCIELYINDEFFTASPGKTLPMSGSFPAYSTVYEDDFLAVLQKPNGVLSHADENANPGLLEAFIHEFSQNFPVQGDSENGFRPALCTRLDRNTEGLLLLAKTYPALRCANALLREGKLQKEYLCITGKEPPQGTFHAFLKRDYQSKTVCVTQQTQDGAKPISTRVECLAQSGAYHLCRIGLLTGRTHQIRAHMSYLGAPLLGDEKYGGPAFPKDIQRRGQALCAFRLTFSANIEKNLVLSSLSGQSFEAKDPQLLMLWKTLGGTYFALDGNNHENDTDV